MGGFSIDKYNRLLDIDDANTRFQEEIISAGITLAELFRQLEPLFLEEGVAGRYSPWLIHHHFALEDGERMVSYGNISKPTKDTSSNIVPESWISSGEEVEHRFVEFNSSNSLPPPPSIDFFAKFKAIVDQYGINSLGVCYAPMKNELAPGFVFLETLMPETREQVVNVVPKSATGSGKTIAASWILTESCSTVTQQCVVTCINCKGVKHSSVPQYM